MSASADYGRRVPAAGEGGVVASVVEGGPGARSGLRAGDTVVSADGHPLHDVIDWQWYADGPAVALDVLRAGASGASGARTDGVVLTRRAGESWGLEFTETVFDGVRTCRNRCAFCFMAQLPKGLRRALYLRDDDFRLSFLQGNFITLTNLADADVVRIAEQHLSPLYVSLHAVDPAVRAELVCAKEDRALQRFDELLEAGIDLHVQVVLVPGVNDGEVLQRSLRWLAEREGVESVGIVPLGFTAHQQRFAASYGEPAAARAVIDAVAPWQEAMWARDGRTWVYLADEFYLNADVEIPPAEHYDDFPQFENGIGMVRDFVDATREQAPELRDAIEALPAGVPVTVLTGELFAPVLARELAALGAAVAGGVSATAAGFSAGVRVAGVRNDFFGGNVSVAGLLASADLEREIAASPADGVVLVPACVANADGLLLDGVSADTLGTASGRDVRLLSCDAGGLLEGLRDVAENPPSPKE